MISVKNIKILVIDDEKAIGDMIRDYLETQNYEEFWAKDGYSALNSFKKSHPDLVILDLMLPGKSGFDICKEIRQISNIPIIMLTAKSDEIDRVLGLELGADDYVTKPFSLRELTARVKAVLRRVGKDTEKQHNILKVGDISIDTEAYRVTVSGIEILLTPTEFSILLFLAERPGKVGSRLQLIDASLGEAYIGYERSIDTHISNLRKKIEDDPSNPKRLQTVYGIGYRLVP